MKILSILTYYYPHWTGLTAYAQRTAEGLAARGHQVTVLTTHHDPETPAREVINGVRVLRLRPAGRISRGMVCPEFPLAAARLIAQHDAVQIHTPLMESMLVALLCRAAKQPLVITHHGDLVMPAGAINAVIERGVVGMMTVAEHLAARISVHSRDYAEHSDFLWPFASKLAYIYPPIEIPEPDQGAAARWRTELGLDNRHLIGFAGRFVEEKGFDYLLRAVPNILQADPLAHLVYAGEHNVVYERFFDRCQQLLDQHREHISFVGLVREPQRLANFYAMCDAVAVPSRTDCFPSVQVESMLCGTPVVTADIPGAREAMLSTGMGRLVAARDPAALAEGLTEVVGAPDRYAKSRAEIRAVFNTDRTIDQYEALMAEVAHQPTPRPRSEPARLKRAQSGPVPARRDRNGATPSTWLTEADRALLGQILRNEADMAYRRRVPVLLDYLELKDGDRVLDCGCGMGFYLMAMGKLRRLRLVGVDGDVGRLAWAQRESVSASLLSTDIECLPFADESFDKVLMTEVLEHLDDDRRALRELYRILRPGGILSVSVPHTDYPFWWDPISRIWTGLGGEPFRTGPLVGIWTNHERLYRPEDLTVRVQEAGFAIEAAEELTHYSFPFIHFLVYGIGKPLLERNLLPESLRKSADRFSGQTNNGSWLNPINVGVATLRLVDRLNEHPRVARKRTFVNVLVKARKPA